MVNNIYISNISALNIHRWWRINRPHKLYYKHNFEETPKYNRDSKKKFIDWYKNTFAEKLDIIVQDKNKSFSSKNLIFHVFNNIPNKSFAEIKSGILISNPEFMFLQLANNLALFDLVKIGYEICGNYVYDISQNKFISCKKPLSSVKKINNTINAIKRTGQWCRGINKAQQALKLICENSFSPQETNLYIKLCADTKYGGFGVKNLRLNQAIKLSAKARQLAGQQSIMPDISNTKTKIAIEYDSDEFHDNQFQNRKDKRRIDALLADGWKVYSFVPGQVNNISTFYKMATDILKNNNQSNRIRVKNFNDLQNSLFRNL